MAHLVEHVTFLGSTKREALHGTGARSNAYTDFHHTVFHVHAPQKSMGWGQSPLLPKVRHAQACVPSVTAERGLHACKSRARSGTDTCLMQG